MTVAIRSGSCAAPSPSRLRAITRGAHGLRVPPAMSARTVLLAIRVIHQESRKTSGSPSIWNALLKQGHRIGEHRVARLMRQDGIRAKTVKKWRATTQSHHRFPVATNTLNRQFTVKSPEPGLGEGHHLRLDDRGLALPRRGHRSLLAPSRRLGDPPLTVELTGAHHGPGERMPGPGCCTIRIAAVSMPRRLPTRAWQARHRVQLQRSGNCWDNACVESFFGTLKRELVSITTLRGRGATPSTSISRSSIIGSADIRPSAMTPRPSTKRGRRLLNQVSTELGEGLSFLVEKSNNL